MSSLFTSATEKRYWQYALLVLLAIYATLALGRPLQEMLRDQNVQAVFFLLGLLLTGAVIALHGWKARPARAELIIWLGLVAVYTMFFFRLGAPERSHLIEYSVLAVFIHRALLARMGPDRVVKPAAVALLITIAAGGIDEMVQRLLPNRTFDPEDIVFNSLAALMAVGTGVILQWARRKFRRAA